MNNKKIKAFLFSFLNIFSKQNQKKKSIHDSIIYPVTDFFFTSYIVVITFAIEIGQKISDSGTMDFADIVFGIAGFLLMFVIFLL